jgi:CBS-domain-containing membrane protein
MRAADVMTRNVMTVFADDLATFAARKMGECDCGAIPVVDRQGRMIGMITDRDIAVRLVGNRMDTRHARVHDCMTDEVFACHVNSSLDECMRMMSQHQVRRIPVLDGRDRVVGIISQADLAQHAAENYGRGERRAVSDVVCAVSEPTDGSYS